MTETKIFNNKVLTNLAKETVENKINRTKGTVKILIQGILTSSIRPKPSTDTPFYGYLRPDSANKHSLAECERTKCQECEIPVIFRWISKNHRVHEMEPKEECFNEKEHWQNPNLKKGDKVILEGEFSERKKSHRPSFTCYSYQLISHGR